MTPRYKAPKSIPKINSPKPAISRLRPTNKSNIGISIKPKAPSVSTNRSLPTRSIQPSPKNNRRGQGIASPIINRQPGNKKPQPKTDKKSPEITKRISTPNRTNVDKPKMNTVKTSRDKQNIIGKGNGVLKNSRTVNPFKLSSPRVSEGKKGTRKDKMPKARNDKNIMQRVKPESKLSSNFKETKTRSRTFTKNTDGFLQKRTAERKSRILEGINTERERKGDIGSKTDIEGRLIKRNFIGDKSPAL
jgi:hypothetical protein